MLDEEIKVSKDTTIPSEHGTKFEHPSFGSVSVSRVSCSRKQKVFGSDVGSNTLIKLEISQSDVVRKLSTDWHHSNKTIAEVYLTPVQYAEMISNPNTSGVPCTINYVRDVGRIEPRFLEDKTVHCENELDSLFNKIPEKVKQSRKRIDELLSKKGTLKKDEKEEISSLMRRIESDINSNLEFKQKRVFEQVQQAKSEAIMNIENHVNTVINKTGLKALQNPDIVNKLLDDNSNEC